MAKRLFLWGAITLELKRSSMNVSMTVGRMYQSLVQCYGFMPEDIHVMVDSDSSFPVTPYSSISVVTERVPSEPDSNDNTNDNTGYDECIVPCDMNPIIDDDFRAFVHVIPLACRITSVSDSCHSGGLISGAKE